MKKNTCTWKPFHEIAIELLLGENGPWHVETMAALIVGGTKVPFDEIEALRAALLKVNYPTHAYAHLGIAISNLEEQWAEGRDKIVDTVTTAFEDVVYQNEEEITDNDEFKFILREFMEKPPEDPDKINIIIAALISAGYGIGLEQDGNVGPYLKSAILAYWSDFGDREELIESGRVKDFLKK